MFYMFNIYYWIYVIVTVVLMIVLDKVIIKFDKDKQLKWISILCWVNFAIHFLKVLTFKDINLKDSLYKIALTNLCAVNIFLYPFVLKLKNKLILNYFEFMGFFSGIIAIVICYDLNDTVAFQFSNIRYWLSHFILLFVSFELMRTKIVKFSYRSIVFCYLCFFIEQGIIYLNDCVMFWTGITERIDHSNAAFTYGLRENALDYLGFARYLIPNVFYNNGEYTPVLWMLVPMLIVLLLAFIISVVFIDKEGFKSDFDKIKGYIKEKKLKK